MAFQARLCEPSVWLGHWHPTSMHPPYLRIIALALGGDLGCSHDRGLNCGFTTTKSGTPRKLTPVAVPSSPSALCFVSQCSLIVLHFSMKGRFREDIHFALCQLRWPLDRLTRVVMSSTVGNKQGEPTTGDALYCTILAYESVSVTGRKQEPPLCPAYCRRVTRNWFSMRVSLTAH